MTGAPREAYAPRDFIIVSLAAVRALGGSWEAAGCFQRIAWRAERDGYWRATMQQIADEIGVSERTAKRITTKLREHGWLTAERENTWESTLTWRVNFADDNAGSAKLAPSEPEDETAGQAAEGQADPVGSDNLALSGVPAVAPSESANEALAQSANQSLSSLQTVDTSKTTDDSLRSSSAPTQPTLVAVDSNTDGARSTRHIGKSGKKPKPEDSPLWSTASSIGTVWWDHYQANYGKVTRVGTGSPYVALVKNVILPALEAGWTEREVQLALMRPATSDGIPDAVPDKQRFQRALVAVRTGAPAPGQRGVDNAHRVPENDPDRQARANAF